MAQLATPEELASYLQQDLDASTANLVLDAASAEFEDAADTKFASTSATLTVEGCGQTVVAISYYPVIAVSQVRIDGVVVSSSDYVLVGQNLYRASGWGGRTWRPEKVEIDLTYGYTGDIPDDVKGAVLEMAGAGYGNPNLATREQIDDYAIQYTAGGGVGLTDHAAKVANRYRFAGFS